MTATAAGEGGTEVRSERRGPLGILTLDRPEALNALNHEMIRALRAHLDAWRDDPLVSRVVLRGAGDRAFCAGGDVVAQARTAAEDPALARRYWREEYALDLAIARYPKPVVALMDGIVLGGGIGLSAHASHRVVTERSRLGMPEVTIGFVPDVGGTHLLSRAPGELGTHLALTGGSIGAADGLLVGLADALVASERVPDLVALLETTEPDDAIAACAVSPPPSELAQARPWIDAAYAGDSVPRILENLRTAGHDEIADLIATKSPLALAVTLASLRRARTETSLDEALDREFRVSARFLAEPDFAEGVRAQLIDKDREPRWNPATLDGIDDARVDAFFAPLPSGEH